ncbi:MAG: DEAD/DEAH box helicase [Candidatus Methanomethylicia archaeon]
MLKELPKTRLRPYQAEAVEWALNIALSDKGAVVCLPTGTGKTIIALSFIYQLVDKFKGKILVLEPTRFLVQQVARRFSYEGFDVSYIHSGVSNRDWNRRIIVTTPESALSYISIKHDIIEGTASKEFPITIIDECHHTVGQDPFAKVIKYLRNSIKLGLSALIPKSREHIILDNIGPIGTWDFEDLEGKGYKKPYVIAEVYDSPLRDIELNIYKQFYYIWLKGYGFSYYASLAMTMLSRDGSDSLIDSLRRNTEFSNFIRSTVDTSKIPSIPHKLDSLKNILEDHRGFEKAIVFVNRRVNVDSIINSFKEYNPVPVIGGVKTSNPKVREKILRDAEKSSSKLIVATSAGDEGIDIPEIDLLIFWSQTASPIRLYQRLGRGLRPSNKIKYAVFIATPETRDYDVLPEGLQSLAWEGIDCNGIFNETTPIWPGRSHQISEYINELAENIGVKAIKGKLIVEALSRSGFEPVYITWLRSMDKIENTYKYKSYFNIRKIRGVLRDGVKTGNIYFFYDVLDLAEKLANEIDRLERISSLDYSERKINIRMIMRTDDRKYYSHNEHIKIMSKYPESFIEDEVFIPLNLKFKGVPKSKVRELGLKNLIVKPSNYVKALKPLSEKYPNALVEWMIKGVEIHVNDRIKIIVSATYGPYRLKNQDQIMAALQNTIALMKISQHIYRISRQQGTYHKII